MDIETKMQIENILMAHKLDIITFQEASVLMLLLFDIDKSFPIEQNITLN